LSKRAKASLYSNGGQYVCNESGTSRVQECFAIFKMPKRRAKDRVTCLMFLFREVIRTSPMGSVDMKIGRSHNLVEMLAAKHKLQRTDKQHSQRAFHWSSVRFPTKSKTRTSVVGSGLTG
jgi:hypothetical protein